MAYTELGLSSMIFQNHTPNQGKPGNYHRGNEILCRDTALDCQRQDPRPRVMEPLSGEGKCIPWLLPGNGR